LGKKKDRRLLRQGEKDAASPPPPHAISGYASKPAAVLRARAAEQDRARRRGTTTQIHHCCHCTIIIITIISITNKSYEMRLNVEKIISLEVGLPYCRNALLFCIHNRRCVPCRLKRIVVNLITLHKISNNFHLKQSIQTLAV
jgi:hypothetical protein